MPTVKERILELSPLSTGTVAEHLMAITLGYGSGGNVYEVQYVPSEEEEIHYQFLVEIVEYLKGGIVNVVYVPKDTVEISLVENLITIEMVSPAQIEVTYEPDSDNN
jgi:hypothetical protein